LCLLSHEQVFEVSVICGANVHTVLYNEEMLCFSRARGFQYAVKRSLHAYVKSEQPSRSWNEFLCPLP
jgi:hypothetical protein